MNDKYILNIQKDLIAFSDTEYKNFHSKLIPTVNPDLILGVRVPVIRNYANALYNSGQYEVFINSLPHKFYEEYQLHSFLICKIKDFNRCIIEIERFLPCIDNWAVCDSLRPVCFAKNKNQLLARIKNWIKSDEPYTVRFAIEMLMCHFLDDDYKTEFAELVAEVISDDYYVNMMISWYFATALAKQYDSVVLFMENKKLPLWVHNKTIQKAVESNRISDDRKIFLRSLKIKK